MTSQDNRRISLLLVPETHHSSYSGKYREQGHSEELGNTFGNAEQIEQWLGERTGQTSDQASQDAGADTQAIESGVENEEGVAVGTDASDTVVFDFTA